MKHLPVIALPLLLITATPAAAACGSDLPPGPAAPLVADLIAELGGSMLSLCTFYGDYTGDGSDDSLVFLYFQPTDGGNSFALDVWALASDGGIWRRDAKLEIFGEEPRNARLSPGRIVVTTTMPGPNDPRCCPSQPTNWTVTVR